MSVHPGPRAVAREGHRARQQLEEHAAQRVLIDPPVERLHLDLLRRRVVQAGGEVAARGEPGSVTRTLGDPEVGEVDAVGAARIGRGAEQDVRGFHVAVQQAVPMRVIEG